MLEINDCFAYLSHLALVLLLNLSHFLSELFLTQSDGLLLSIMHFLSFSIALDELMFQEGKGLVHAFDELILL